MGQSRRGASRDAPPDPDRRAPHGRHAAPARRGPPPRAAAGRTPFGGSLLDAVEAAGTRVADYQEQIAEATPLPWVANAARANAEFTRIVTRAYVTSGR